MGEFELIELLRRRLPQSGPQVLLGSGDDAAITAPRGATATSVDALVEGAHFRREWSNLAQIGAKALAVALSDIAAMGAEAGEAYVVLGVPVDLDEDGCLELLDGMIALAEETGTALAGGDITRAPALTLAITAVGHAESAGEMVKRSGARPGDALCVTGELGGAAAGLLLLEHGPGEDVPGLSGPYGCLSPDTSAELLARQLEPQPRLEAGRALAKAGATAMIDLSDGLGGDARHLSKASGVRLEIDAGALPIAAGVAEVAAAGGRNPLALAAGGGEDYELFVALPPERVEEAVRAVSRLGGLTRIGEVLAGEGVEIRLPGGELLEPTGFDQLG